MAIYLKITNPTEVVKKKTSKWLTDITPERIDRKLVEDEVIKGIIEQLTLEGIKAVSYTHLTLPTKRIV